MSAPSEDGAFVVPSPEYIAAAREMVRQAAENLGPIPDGCSKSYALISASLQGLFPAVLEATDPGVDGAPHDADDVSLMIQGVGAGLAAFLARSRDSERGVYLAIINDLVRGMINVETTSLADRRGVDRAHELLAAFGVMPSGKGIN